MFDIPSYFSLQYWHASANLLRASSISWLNFGLIFDLWYQWFSICLEIRCRAVEVVCKASWRWYIKFSSLKNGAISELCFSNKSCFRNSTSEIFKLSSANTIEPSSSPELLSNEDLIQVPSTLFPFSQYTIVYGLSVVILIILSEISNSRKSVFLSVKNYQNILFAIIDTNLF